MLEVADRTHHTRTETGPEPEMPGQGRFDTFNRIDPHVLYEMGVLQADVLEIPPALPGVSRIH